MPAARPSQPAIANALGALVAAGLQPAAIHVGTDGSFRIDVAGTGVAAAEQFARPAGVRDDLPSRWDDIDE